MTFAAEDEVLVLVVMLLLPMAVVVSLLASCSTRWSRWSAPPGLRAPSRCSPAPPAVALGKLPLPSGPAVELVSELVLPKPPLPPCGLAVELLSVVPLPSEVPLFCEPPAPAVELLNVALPKLLSDCCCWSSPPLLPAGLDRAFLSPAPVTPFRQEEQAWR